MGSMKKICFVMPEYARATHFQYVAEFVESLADEADIFLVIEKGELPETSKVTKRTLQRFRSPLLRFFEIALILLRARLSGYRVQYIHYSFSAAFWSSIITRTLGGTTYYWNAGMPWLYQRPYSRELFERLVYKMIGRLVTGAEAIVSGYAAYYGISPSKIIVIPNWIDSQEIEEKLHTIDRDEVRRQLDIPNGAPVLLFVHRLSKRKGAHLLPGILAGASKKAILVVAGDGPEEATLKQKFEQLGLTERVRMLGAIPQQRVINYFSITDVFLLPSEEEGCPHVLLEALAAGVPYAAMAVGGVREITPPKLLPYVSEAGDVSGFIHGVNTLLLFPSSHREAIIQDEREWVKRYGKKEILNRFLALVQ